MGGVGIRFALIRLSPSIWRFSASAIVHEGEKMTRQKGRWGKSRRRLLSFS